MLTTYAATVTLGYGARGDLIAGFMPDSLDEGPIKRAVGFLLV